jgi:hypothetical protein
MTDNTPTSKQEEGGLVTVPREPTLAMLAAVDDMDDDKFVARGRAVDAWSRMLAAAPATPHHNEDGLRKALEHIIMHDDLDAKPNDLVQHDRASGAASAFRVCADIARQALGDIPSG